MENTSNSKVIVGLGTGDASDWAIACLNGRGLRHVEGDARPGRITGMMIFVPSGVRMAWLSEPTPAGRDVGAASRLWPSRLPPAVVVFSSQCRYRPGQLVPADSGLIGPHLHASPSPARSALSRAGPRR